MKAFKEFLESSTIHGLSYISTSRTGLGKLVWSSFVLTGFSLAAYLITSSYMAMKESPISTSISTHSTSSLAQSYKKQNELSIYETGADVPESRVWLRADFQSGSLVLKKVF